MADESTESITITTEEGKEFVLTREMISFTTETKNTQEEKFVPHVIEPSFGIGRIIYCVFEHCFRQRAEDAQRVYFAFPPAVAPVKTSLLPLVSNSEEYRAKIQQLSKSINLVRCLLQLQSITNFYHVHREAIGEGRHLVKGR